MTTPVVLATVDDLRNRLQDPNITNQYGQAAIDAATALVKAVARQQFVFTRQVVELVGGTRILTLPQRPVVEDEENPLLVEQLALSGAGWASVQGEGWYRVDDRLIRYWPTQWVPQMQSASLWQSSRLWGPFPHPGVWPPRVRVTYSSGWRTQDEVPPELTAIVVKTAVTLYTNPQGLRSEQVGGVTIQWAHESLRGPSDLTDQLRKELSAIGIRRKHVFSVAPA